MIDRCAIAGCRAEAEIDYLGHGLCAQHWEAFTAGDVGPDALRMALGIEADAPATEEAMSIWDDTLPKADEDDPESIVDENTNAADESAATEDAMTAKKKTATKAKTTKAKAAKTKAAKAPKPPKTKKERPPKEDLCVFACRVAEAERVKFHEATGPGGATRFARKLMVVFSNEDEAGFRALLKEAREARG